MSITKQLPPGPKEPPLIGSAKHLVTDMPFFLLKLARDFGPLASFHIGKTPVPQLLGWTEHGLVFDVAVHIGSLVAVLYYFRHEVFRMLPPCAPRWRQASCTPSTTERRLIARSRSSCSRGVSGK